MCVATAGLAVLLACAAEDNQTQVTVLLTSETQIPKELDSLELVVTSANGSEASRVIHEVQNPRFFPATVALVPRNADALEGPVKIELRGYLNGQDAQVFRRAVVSYVEGRTMLLRMPLRMACFNFQDCGKDNTCAGGTCQPARVPSAELVDFDPKYVSDDDTTRCFDEAACLSDSQVLKLEQDCTFALPTPLSIEGGRPKVNVSIRWAAANNRVIVLDEGDAVEGWTREGERGRLSKGVCVSLFDPEPDPKKRAVPDQALDARISTKCAAKSSLQPYCSSATGQTGIGAVIAVR
jgi:hypothetical protein